MESPQDKIDKEIKEWKEWYKPFMSERQKELDRIAEEWRHKFPEYYRRG